MSGNLVESLVGALVLVVAAWFLNFAYERTEMNASLGYELTARFDRIDGLHLGSDVRISGIKVGSVIDQSIDPETYEAIVTISINNDIKLPTDTVAAITSEGLLGGSYLSLMPGGMDEMMVAGDVISDTQDAIDLVGLMGRFMYGSDDKKDE